MSPHKFLTIFLLTTARKFGIIEVGNAEIVTSTNRDCHTLNRRMHHAEDRQSSRE